MADSTDPIQQPQDWDKVVSVAYLRILGQTQEDAAKGAGVGVRSLIRWEQCSWWEDAKHEAADRWLNNVVAHSRNAVLTDIRDNGNASMALTLLERLDGRLAPPKLRAELSGPDGGPIEHKYDLTQLPDKDLELFEQLARRAAVANTN